MPSLSPDQQDAQALAEALRPVLHRLLRQLRRQADDMGVTPLQNLLLAVIRDNPGIGVGELAQQENLRSPTISGHIKALAAAGLVERKPPADGDRRRVGLAVTAQGRKVLEAVRKRRTDQLAGLLVQLSPAARAGLHTAIDGFNEIGL